jgi:hypothetical protein
VDGGNEILEVAVLDDEPLVAEGVLPAPDLRARGLRSDAEKLVDVLLGARELARRERLEDDGCDTGRAELELGLERDAGGREREQLVELGALEALAAEQDVSKSHDASS